MNGGVSGGGICGITTASISISVLNGTRLVLITASSACVSIGLLDITSSINESASVMSKSIYAELQVSPWDMFSSSIATILLCSMMCAHWRGSSSIIFNFLEAQKFYVADQLAKNTIIGIQDWRKLNQQVHAKHFRKYFILRLVDPEIVVIILPFLFEKENINIVITMIINDIIFFLAKRSLLVHDHLSYYV